MMKKTISTKLLVTICAMVLIGSSTAAVLVTSNPIHITVTAPLPPVYDISLTANGTSTDPYDGIINPGDTLILEATASSNAVGRTVVFYNNPTYPIGSVVVKSDNTAEFIWVVPALTHPPDNDVYVLRADLT